MCPEELVPQEEWKLGTEQNDPALRQGSLTFPQDYVGHRWPIIVTIKVKIKDN